MALVESSSAARPASSGAELEPDRHVPGASRRSGCCSLFLLILPAFASNFVLIEIFGWAMILGMIALSLMFLAGYGGMVSLVQMTVAGCAGYMVAIFGTSADDRHQPGLAVVGRRAARDPDRGDLRNALRRRSRCAPRASTRS